MAKAHRDAPDDATLFCFGDVRLMPGGDLTLKASAKARRSFRIAQPSAR